MKDKEPRTRWTPLLWLRRRGNTKATRPEKHPQNNNTTAAHFDRDPAKGRQKQEREREKDLTKRLMFRTLIHLGVRTAASNYRPGKSSEGHRISGLRNAGVVFRPVYMNRIPCVVWQPLKNRVSAFVGRSHWLPQP